MWPQHKVFLSASQLIHLRYAIGYLDAAREQHLARVARIELKEIESDCLQMIIKKGSDWRERERAETVSLKRTLNILISLFVI